jgi:hypothetical protein
MVELVRSRQVLTLATLAAALWALALVLAGLGEATFSLSSQGTSSDLATAASWLDFVAAFGALSACCYSAWSFLVRQDLQAALQIGGLAVATLLFAVGFLMQATSAPNFSDAGFIVSAVGLGGWAVLLVVQAARHSIQEQQNPTVPRQAGILMSGAGAIVVLAVALGLPSPSITDTALAVTGEVIYGLAWMALAMVLYVARERRFITSPQVVTVQAGLWVLFASAVVLAVTDGVIYGTPPISLTGLRLDSIGLFIEAVGFVVLGVAAVRRMGEVPAPSAAAPAIPHGSPQPPWYPPPPPETAPTTAPPAWQPDPFGRHEARWWDGMRWTEYVLDAGRPGTDPPA